MYSIENTDYDEVGNAKCEKLTGTEEYGLKRETRYTHNENNLVYTITDAAGVTTNNCYDEDGNLIKT